MDKPADPPPKRGRPPVAEPGSSVSTWLRQGEHDELIRLAQQHDTTVSSLVRQWLKLRITPTK
jgi:hypothetical protein